MVRTGKSAEGRPAAMNFKSDNTTSVHPKILAALSGAADDHSPSYGADAASAALRKRLSELFACDLEVFLTATGTAANSLALAALTPSYGAIYAQSHSHINCDE